MLQSDSGLLIGAGEPFPKLIEKRSNPISEQEYLLRNEKVALAMSEKDLDCVLVTDAANICYLSGYLAESSYVAQGVVLYKREKYPYLFLRRQDAPAGMYLSFMPNDHIFDYPETLIGNASSSGFDFIFETLSDHGARRVGVELDAISASTLSTLQSRYPSIEIVDISGMVVWHRLKKSDAEIALQRDAARITDHVMHQLKGWFVPGRRECDVAAEITAGLISGTPDCPGDKTDPILMPGGAQTGTSHIAWTDKVIEKGAHYNPEFGASRFGYCVGLMRTVSIGKPTSKLDRLYNYMIEGCDEALAAVKPGATCASIARKYSEIIEKGGYWKDSRCGYPIGINWLEDSCSLRADDETLLEENMVFHLMLGTWLEEDFGAVISETFVVTQNGCDVLGQVPREMIVV